MNNADIVGSAITWGGATLADFKKIVDVNLNSQFIGIQGRRRLNDRTHPVYGLVSFPDTRLGYSASKGAIQILTKTASVGYADRNISVNSV